MKALGLVSLLITLSIIGYMMMKQTQAAGPEGTPSVDRAKMMEDKARAAVAQAGDNGLKAAIDNFKSDKQRWPDSLDELKTAGFIESVPGDMDYDPATGEVKRKEFHREH